MKKYLFFLVSFLLANIANSQVLYTENFNNHSMGNLGTDYTGIIPGQWGWITKADTGSTQANSIFSIIPETNRGMVLDITAVSKFEELYVFKPNLSQVIDSRTTGNDVIKFEMDYFTGPISTIPHQSTEIWILRKDAVMDYFINPEWLFRLNFNKTNGIIGAQTLGAVSLFGGNGTFYSLPFNTWVKLIIYFDYQNKTAYLDIPILKKAFSSDFLKNTNSVNIMQDYKPDKLVFTLFMTEDMNKPPGVTRNRYDDIKITALSAVPPEVIALSTNEQLSAKFNIFPNPANNIVNITNNENRSVQQVTIYDISGKQLKTENFDSSQQIQLNVENLSSGTYMLHIQTDQGTAIKKLIKK